MNLNQKGHQSSGYIALASMLVILVVVLAIGISVSLLSISEVQLALGGKKSLESLYLVESCAQLTLLEIAQDANLPEEVTLPKITCSVSINSQGNNKWDFTVSGEFDNYSRSINIVAERENRVVINSWNEI